MTPGTQHPRRWPDWLALLATLAIGLAVYYYFTGAAATLPWQLIPHLTPVPLPLDSVAVGAAQLPVPVNGFVVSLTHDVAGPLTQPVAAGMLLVLLAGCLAGWLAVLSLLPRLRFVAGMVPVIFLLQSLNLDTLGVFAGVDTYFLYLTLAVLGGTAFGLQAFGEQLPLWKRSLLLLALVAGLSTLLLAKSQLPLAESVLQLAAYATPGGAVLVALLVLWVSIENVRALLWFNTQAEEPSGRFGLPLFLLASGLYLAALAWLWANDGQLLLYPGLRLDPLVLLLPATLAAGLGLQSRAPSYAAWVPYAQGARQLYPLLLTAAAAALAYAFATDNTPLLDAARSFTNLALLALGAAYTFYLLANFAALIQQRLRVYRVVFEPRRFPFYAVYVLGIASIGLVQLRGGWPLLAQVQAGLYNNLGDLTRQLSEAHPDDFSQAVLAERYYAESGDVLYRSNARAQLGRAALYRFNQQRQNETNALIRGLQRGPSEKVSVRLAALYQDPADFLDGLEALREGVHDNPRSARLTDNLAQLFTRSRLTDSVAFYLDRAELLAPGSYVSKANRLGFLQQQNLAAARRLAADIHPAPHETALRSNLTLLELQLPPTKNQPPVKEYSALTDLTDDTFADLYHAALAATRRADTRLLPMLLRLGARPANTAYYEQLLFLQALTRHAAGEERAARQLLAPLAVGSSATAGYYQYLLGMWQLRQQQYATAADNLALAVQHATPAARLPYAYALALAGQADSARAEASRSLTAAADNAQRQAAQTLLRQLAALAPGERLSAAAGQQLAGSQWLVRARQAEQQNQPAEARRWYQRVVREAPFNEVAVRTAAAYYTRQRSYLPAYETLRAGLDENPHSLPLLQAYVLAATDAGLAEYASTALAQVQAQLTPAAYATFLGEYRAHQAAQQAAATAFSAQ